MKLYCMWKCFAIEIIDMFYNLLSHLLAIFPTVFPLQFTSLIGIEGIWNFTGADAGNPKFHHIKTVLCKNCFQHTFSDDCLRISHHSNLSHSVFFSIDLFFRHRLHEILHVQMLETLDSITQKLYCVKPFLTHLFR